LAFFLAEDAGVTLSQSSLSLTVGGTVNIRANISPPNAANKAVGWSTSNPNVATVTGSVDAIITAVGAGTAIITVTTAEGGYTATCAVTIKSGDGDGTAVTGVTLNKTSLSLTVNATETLTAAVEPSNAANKNVTWSSSNTSVATVNSGLVTAVALGSATITVTTADGNKTATCYVTVTGGGGNIFTSVDAMTNWLKTQSDNSVTTPYDVKLNVSSLNSLAWVGTFSSKYVNLDLSDSTFTSMGKGFFGASKYLTGVIIPNSILSIGEGAFGVCSNLASITIPSNVTSIEGNAFYGCTILTSVTFQGAGTTISNSSTFPSISSLLTAYKAGGAGTYKLSGSTWTKQ